MQIFSSLGNAITASPVQTVLSKDDIEYLDQKYCFTVDLERISASV
jgi:hypothetical protein